MALPILSSSAEIGTTQSYQHWEWGKRFRRLLGKYQILISYRYLPLEQRAPSAIYTCYCCLLEKYCIIVHEITDSLVWIEQQRDDSKALLRKLKDKIMTRIIFGWQEEFSFHLWLRFVIYQNLILRLRGPWSLPHEELQLGQLSGVYCCRWPEFDQVGWVRLAKAVVWQVAWWCLKNEVIFWCCGSFWGTESWCCDCFSGLDRLTLLSIETAHLWARAACSTLLDVALRLAAASEIV